MNNKLLGKYCDAQEEDEAEYYETLEMLIEEKKLAIEIEGNKTARNILQQQLEVLEKIAYE